MSGMRCPRCQRESPSVANFCWECGARLAAPDPRDVSPQRDSFGELIDPPRSALEGEHKQITVLFADLKSSMELIADRDRRKQTSSSIRCSNE